MTNPLYTKLLATAIALLNKFGAVSKLGIVPLQRSVKTVLWKTVKHTIVDSKIQVGDMVYIMAPKTVDDADPAPLEGERLWTVNDKGVIVQVEKIQPADVLVLYYVWVRKG